MDTVEKVSFALRRLQQQRPDQVNQKCNESTHLRSIGSTKPVYVPPHIHDFFEIVFEESPVLTVSQAEMLSEYFDITLPKVLGWFRNRRRIALQKERKSGRGRMSSRRQQQTTELNHRSNENHGSLSFDADTGSWNPLPTVRQDLPRQEHEEWATDAFNHERPTGVPNDYNQTPNQSWTSKSFINSPDLINPVSVPPYDYPQSLAHCWHPRSVAPHENRQSVAPSKEPQAMATFEPRQSVAPFGNPQSVASYGIPQSETPNGYPQSVAPYANPQSGTPKGYPQSVAPYANPQSVGSYGIPLTGTPYGNPQSVAANGNPQSVAPKENPKSVALYRNSESVVPFGYPQSVANYENRQPDNWTRNEVSHDGTLFYQRQGQTGTIHWGPPQQAPASTWAPPQMNFYPLAQSRRLHPQMTQKQGPPEGDENGMHCGYFQRSAFEHETHVFAPDMVDPDTGTNQLFPGPNFDPKVTVPSHETAATILGVPSVFDGENADSCENWNFAELEQRELKFSEINDTVRSPPPAASFASPSSCFSPQTSEDVITPEKKALDFETQTNFDVSYTSEDFGDHFKLKTEPFDFDFFIDSNMASLQVKLEPAVCASNLLSELSEFADGDRAEGHLC